MNTKNIIMKTRNKVANNMTVEKWLNFLNEARDIFDGNSNMNISDLTYAHKVSGVWQTFLIKHKIIEKDLMNNWVWNQKIPVSKSLIVKFREFQQEMNKNTYRKSKDVPGTQQELDLLIETTKPKKKSKLKIDMTKSKLYAPYQEKNVGLILKFLKWIN